MTVWVIRDGRLVDKASVRAAVADRRAIFPAPMLSRITPYDSPVTGAEISSWRARDADMKAVDAVDPRDFGKDHFFRRGRAAQLKEAQDAAGQPEPDFWRERR